jgi:hypothetical protein
LRAPPAKLHQDPPFPTTPYLPAAPRFALHSRTRSNTRLSSVVFQFTATCPIARPTSSQVTSTSFSCHAHPHHCAPFAIPVISVVIVPPSFPSRARHHRVQLQPPPEGLDALAPSSSEGVNSKRKPARQSARWPAATTPLRGGRGPARSPSTAHDISTDFLGGHI